MEGRGEGEGERGRGRERETGEGRISHPVMEGGVEYNK